MDSVTRADVMDHTLATIARLLYTAAPLTCEEDEQPRKEPSIVAREYKPYGNFQVCGGGRRMLRKSINGDELNYSGRSQG